MALTRDNLQLLKLSDNFEVWRDVFNNAIRWAMTVPGVDEDTGLIVGDLDGNAATATLAELATAAVKLQTARSVLVNLESLDEVSFDGTADIRPGVTGILPMANGGTGNSLGHIVNLVNYAACTTSGTSANKRVTIDDFNRTTGSIVFVKFSNTNLADAPTLNVSSTGAASILYNGEPYTSLQGGALYVFVFTGEDWEIIATGSNVAMGATSSITTANINNLTSAGTFFVPANSGYSNLPISGSTDAWWIHVYKYEDNLLQEAQCHSVEASSATSGPANRLVRCYNGTSWSDWSYMYSVWAG